MKAGPFFLRKFLFFGGALGLGLTGLGPALIGLILWSPKFYDYWCGAASFINITLVVQLDGDEGGIFIPGNIIRWDDWHFLDLFTE